MKPIVPLALIAALALQGWVLVRTGQEDHQGGHSADDDGVDKRTDHGHDALACRLVGLGR